MDKRTVTFECPPCPTIPKVMSSLIYGLMTLFALYLSFLYNGGFDIGGFLGAIAVPFIYIPYKLAEQQFKFA